jgi:TonB family protein
MRTVCAVVVASCVLAGMSHSAERRPLATVSTSEDHAVEGGVWRTLIQRSAEPWECGTQREPVKCAERAIIIDNKSPQTLECRAQLSYRSPDGSMVADPEVPALVLPRSSRELHGRVTAVTIDMEVVSLDCLARPPYTRLKIAEGCKYQMLGKPLEDFYPGEAVRLTLEGPVAVSFLLTEPDGKAAEVAVVDSSLVPSLDEAAKRFIADQRFTTTCPGTRFDLRVRFRLRDDWPRS